MIENQELPMMKDESSINMSKSKDVTFWCEELNLRAEDLKEIVKKVGPSIHEVRVFLAKKLLSQWVVQY